jgi:hypothetical protein
LRAEPAAAHADLRAFQQQQQQQQQRQVQGDQASHHHPRQSGRLTPDSVHDGGGGGNVGVNINHNHNGSSGGAHGNTAPLEATASSSSSTATHSTARSGTLNLSAVRDVYAAAAGLPPSSSSHYDTNRSGNSGVEGIGKGKWPRLAAAAVWVILVLLVAIVGSVSFYLVTAVLFPIKARSVVTTMTISVLLQVTVYYLMIKVNSVYVVTVNLSSLKQKEKRNSFFLPCYGFA